MYSSTDQFVLLPALLLALFGCAVMLLDVFAGRDRWALRALTLAGLAFTAAALWKQYAFLQASNSPELAAFQGALVIDRFGLFFNALFTLASLLVTLAAGRDEHEGLAPENFALLLFAQCGMFFLAAARDLIAIFLGLELMALCFYVMVGLLRRRMASNEAALKYLLLGGFSSGLLAYGFSLLFGISGATNLGEIAAAVAARPAHDPLLMIAVVTITAGLLFKIAAVPFHMWTPDAYDGAPVHVAAYLAVASKAASFAILLRVLLTPLGSVRETWAPFLAVVAVVTLTLGNLAAIGQDNVRRLIAYSSIAHAGYILLGLVAGNPTGLHAVAIYILTYSVVTLGAFFCVAAVEAGGPASSLADFSGLIRRSPWLAVLLLLFLLGLAGLPPAAGFWGKYYIFFALIETGHMALAVVAVLYAAVAAYYYFRLVRQIFTVDGHARPPVTTSAGLKLALAVTGVFTLWIGLFPEPFLRLAEGSMPR